MKPFPKGFGEAFEQIEALRSLVETDADVRAIGRAAALVHLDGLNRILVYQQQFDATFGLQFLNSELAPEENLPLISTILRVQRELTEMLLRLLDGFLNCFGGPQAIWLQALDQWTTGDPHRRELVLKLVADLVSQAKQSRRKKRRSAAGR